MGRTLIVALRVFPSEQPQEEDAGTLNARRRLRFDMFLKGLAQGAGSALGPKMVGERAETALKRDPGPVRGVR